MRKLLTVLLLAAFASTLILMTPNRVKAQPPYSTISIINPGKASDPTMWDAPATPDSETGTKDFSFFTSSPIAGSTFFVNVTITNVTQCKTWGIGVVWDNTTVEFVSASLPSDHAFAPMQGTSVPVPQAFDDVDATHRIFKWGFAYIMPSPVWTFNGSGVLCQIQFEIVGDVNATVPTWASSLTLDPDWTSVYFFPGGSESPPNRVPGTLTAVFDNTPPVIDDPTQSPIRTNVLPAQPVVVGVNVTDADSDVQNVTLYYGQATPSTPLAMVLNSTNGLWEATIPGFASGTTMKYKIQAYDLAGNSAVKDNGTLYYDYTVIPEFTVIAVLTMLTVASVALVAVRKRSRKEGAI